MQSRERRPAFQRTAARVSGCPAVARSTALWNRSGIETAAAPLLVRGGQTALCTGGLVAEGCEGSGAGQSGQSRSGNRSFSRADGPLHSGL